MSSTSAEINPHTQRPFSANAQILRAKAQELPVSKQLNEILNSIKQNVITILVGETGSGKTTQVPQALLSILALGKAIAVTQNRRFAAELIAKRTAEELDVQVGGLVGLKHGMADQIDEKQSRLHIITDGSLVSLAKSDHDLSAYGIIVVDEAHQHTVSTDLLLGLLKGLIVKRKADLKIVIMSATIDTDSFLNFFPGAKLVTVPGRMHQVHVSYLEKDYPPSELVPKIVEVILSVHVRGKPGNILVFVSGVEQMRKIATRVESALQSESTMFSERDVGVITIHRLYSTQSAEKQRAATNSVAPPPRNDKFSRKLILATNIAETSVTLAGVTHVIDSLRVNQKVYNPEDESHGLLELPISKAQAQQRAGRAGRTEEGFAYRMCSQAGYHTQLTDHTVPDIQNGDMLQECLQIVKSGRNPIDFPYMYPPATETIVKALGIHQELGTLTHTGKGLELTAHGENVLSLPVSVFCAEALLASAKFHCVDEMIMIVSMIEATEGGSAVLQPPPDTGSFDKNYDQKMRQMKSSFGASHGDHIMLFNMYIAWRQISQQAEINDWLDDNKLVGSAFTRADALRTKLLRIMGTPKGRKQYGWEHSMGPTSSRFYTRILCALGSGFRLQVAKRVNTGPKPIGKDGKPQKDYELYDTVRHGTRAKIMPKGRAFGPGGSEWVIYSDFSSKGPGKAVLKVVTPIPLEMLLDVSPEYWCRVESMPAGHIRDALLAKIMQLTGLAESDVLVDMSPPPQPEQQQQQHKS